MSSRIEVLEKKRYSNPPVSVQKPEASGAMHNKRAIVFHACSVTGMAFGLNYLWENLHCPWFFIHRGGNPGQLAMVVATLGDVAMTWIAQGVVAAVSRRWLWLLEPWRRRQWTVLLGTALVLSGFVESWALANSLWGYTDINPLVPGTPISVLPVAQLLLLFPLTFGLSRKLIRRASHPSAMAGTGRTSRGKAIKAHGRQPKRPVAHANPKPAAHERSL